MSVRPTTVSTKSNFKHPVALAKNVVKWMVKCYKWPAICSSIASPLQCWAPYEGGRHRLHRSRKASKPQHFVTYCVKARKKNESFLSPPNDVLIQLGSLFFGHFCDCGNFHSPQVGLGKGFSQHLSTSILNGTKFLVTNKNYIRPPAERQRTLVLWPPKIGQLSSWFWGDEIGGCLLRFLGQISSQSTSICSLADFFVRHRP